MKRRLPWPTHRPLVAAFLLFLATSFVVAATTLAHAEGVRVRDWDWAINETSHTISVTGTLENLAYPYTWSDVEVTFYARGANSNVVAQKRFIVLRLSSTKAFQFEVPYRGAPESAQVEITGCRPEL